MNLLLRLFWKLLSLPFRPRVSFLDASVIHLRVWPTDLDLNFHMNNGRYLTVMDLGRLDLTFRCGLGGLLFRRRWRPVVGAARIRFRRSLDPFERYALETRLLGWDAKWLYLGQRFLRADGDLAAEAQVRAVFLGGGGPVAPAEILGALGLEGPSPELPAGLSEWVGI